MSWESEYEIRTAAYEAVALGDAEIVGEVAGEPVFSLTDSGRARAEQIIDTAMVNHGLDAGRALAEAMGVATEVGEALVTMRLHAMSESID